MTQTQIMSYTVFLALAVALTGLNTVHASEVTGTLSSNASSTEAPENGSISGTVTSDSSSSRGGGGSSTRTGRGGSDATEDVPTGTVLGAAASANTQAPGFPNAGSAPGDASRGAAIWSSVTTFFKNLLSL